MIREDQYAGMIMSHKSIQKECEDWKRKYYEVADAITRESFGVEDLCAQARAIRNERDRMKDALTNMANMPEYDQDDSHRLRHQAKLALVSALPNAQAQHNWRGIAAEKLLARWADWARAHGHDVGMLDDTRAFLSI